MKYINGLGIVRVVQTDVSVGLSMGWVMVSDANGTEYVVRPETLTDAPRSVANPKATLGYTPEFEEFWRVYPRRVAKVIAYESWCKALRKVGGDYEHIISGAMRYANAMETQEHQFIAHPSTWLNHGRWDDEYETEPPKPKVDPELAESQRRAAALRAKYEREANG